MVHTVSHTQHLLCVCAVHIVYVHCAMRTRSKVTIVQYSCTVVGMSIVCTLKDGELGVYCLLFMERASRAGVSIILYNGH